jgi:hypothetical protein
MDERYIETLAEAQGTRRALDRLAAAQERQNELLERIAGYLERLDDICEHKGVTVMTTPLNY